MDRREFLKGSALVAAGLVLNPVFTSGPNTYMIIYNLNDVPRATIDFNGRDMGKMEIWRAESWIRREVQPNDVIIYIIIFEDYHRLELTYSGEEFLAQTRWHYIIKESFVRYHDYLPHSSFIIRYGTTGLSVLGRPRCEFFTGLDQDFLTVSKYIDDLILPTDLYSEYHIGGTSCTMSGAKYLFELEKTRDYDQKTQKKRAQTASQ